MQTGGSEAWPCPFRGAPGCGLPSEPRPLLLEWQRLPAVS